MKDQLQSKLIEILSSAQAVGADAYEFVKQQAPQLAEEVVKWRLVEEWSTLIACLLVVLAGIIAAFVFNRKVSKWEKVEGYGEMHPARVGNMFLILLFIPLSFIGPSAKLIVQAKVAPRVFFIKACSDLIR